MTVPPPRTPGDRERLPGDWQPPARGQVGRAVPLVGLAGRSAVEAVWASLRDRSAAGPGAATGPVTGLERARREFHARNAPRYAEWLGRSRGVLFKAAQILAGVLPAGAVGPDVQGVYRAAFTRVLAEAPPMPADLVVDAVTAELGRPPGELFAEFDPTPVAAASIGQVHRARLPDGRAVAVKVQYPGIEQSIEADLANVQLIATFTRLLIAALPGLSRVDVKALAAEVGSRVREELDYTLEAAHQRLFASIYAGHPFIHVPDVLPELSSRRVLTGEYVDGLTFAEAAGAEPGLRDLWGEAVYRFGVCGLRRLGTINADPNPGNYRFHPDGRVSFLDFGCVKLLDAEQVRVATAYVVPTLDGDADAVRRCLVAIGVLDPADLPPAEAVLAYWRSSTAFQFAREPFTVTPEYAAEVVRTRISPVGAHGGVTRRAFIPPWLAMPLRLDIGVLEVLAGLRATAPWGAITDEVDRGTPPVTRYGELDAEFWATQVTK
jgi:hypothetical protein